MSRITTLFALALAAACALLMVWARSQPTVLPDVAVDKLQCVSYAPFRRPGQSPFVPGIVIPREQIAADLQALSTLAECVRTYSVDQGLDVVPQLAGRLDMQVLLGVWIGRDRVQNDAEINRAIAVARAHPAAIRGIVVGNEVLLRREQPPEMLAQYLDRVRKATNLPVTYADVWEFWSRNTALAAATSFVTVHILPYWEDEPVGIDLAIPHIVDIYREMRRTFAGREVLLGETGWPSAGRNRHGAQPGTVEQTRFMREFIRAAAAEGIRYNVIEAVDQPWKRRMEGTVGGHWGVLDENLAAKITFQGPVPADPHWRRGGWAALGGVVVLLALGLTAAGRTARRLDATALATLALAGATIGVGILAQWLYMADSARHWLEWTVNALYTVIGFGFAILVALALAGRAPMNGRSRGAIGRLRFALLFGLAVVGVLLSFDPRYRDVPLALYSVPVGALALARLADLDDPLRAEEKMLALIVASSVPVVLWHEGFKNVWALAWCGLCAVGAAAVLAYQHDGRGDQRHG